MTRSTRRVGDDGDREAAHGDAAAQPGARPTLSAGMTVRHYEITGFLGAGGMGEVYSAHDRRLDRDVAIKVLPVRLAADPDMQGRLAREARAVAAVAHPGVVTIYEFGTFNTRPFVAMELLSGTTLRARLAEGPIPVPEAVRIMDAAAEAVGAAHRRGITHRDLKPDNVFLLADGGVKVLDFGLARWKAVAAPETTMLPTPLQTQRGEFLGTLGYAAPEQLHGWAADARADVFALGCTLLEMLTGARAFSGDSPAAVVSAVLHREPEGLAMVSVPIAAVIRRALAKEPQDRYADARALASALRGAAMPGSTDERPHSRDTSAARFDLIVLGSSHAAWSAARQVAAADRRVLLVPDPAGPATDGAKAARTGRHAMHAALMHGFRRIGVHSGAARDGHPLSLEQLTAHARAIIEFQRLSHEDSAAADGITMWEGPVEFTDPHTIQARGTGGPMAEAAHILLACDASPGHRPPFEPDDDRVLSACGVFHMRELPRDLLVVGAGLEGVELASTFGTLGARVALIDAARDILAFADQEVVEMLKYELRRRGVTLHLGETVVALTRTAARVTAMLAGGRAVAADTLLWTGGWVAATDTLNLPAAGLMPSETGHVYVNQKGQSAVAHIYAVGDVVAGESPGAPLDRVRHAVNGILGWPESPSAQPYAIYSIPEAAGIGATEQELRQASAAYETGCARFERLCQPWMSGDESGELKLLFDPHSLRLLGVHVVGANATELVHVGALAMQAGVTLPVLRNVRFNQPSFGEAYAHAALDGMSRARLSSAVPTREPPALEPAGITATE